MTEFVHILQTLEMWSQLANTFGPGGRREKALSANLEVKNLPQSRSCQENSTANSE